MTELDVRQFLNTYFALALDAPDVIFSFNDQHELRHVREFYDAGQLQKIFSP